MTDIIEPSMKKAEDLIKSIGDKVLYEMDGEEFLKHYGVIGMRWGVSGGRKSKPKLSSDYKVTVPLRNRNTKELSNKQIKTVTSRINAEQNYRRLNPSRIKLGENMVKDVLATLGTAAAVYTFLNSPTGKALRSLGRKKINQQLRLFK